MRFEVPQFIEIEDKIFGPLTWRQFLYLGGGVGMSVVMFFTLPFLAFVIFGLPLAILSGALAFYPINNRPFSPTTVITPMTSPSTIIGAPTIDVETK